MYRNQSIVKIFTNRFKLFHDTAPNRLNLQTRETPVRIKQYKVGSPETFWYDVIFVSSVTNKMQEVSRKELFLLQLMSYTSHMGYYVFITKM